MQKILGVINGESITGFSIYGVETGDIGKTYKSLVDIYKDIKNFEKTDEKMMGYSDVYTITVETDTAAYPGFILKKYRNRYWLT